MNDLVVIFGLQDPNIIERDIDDIAEKHNQYEYARRLIQSVTASKGGRIIGQLQGNEIVTIPVDQAETIRELHQRLNEEARCPCSVGVGENAEQALEALHYADKNAPDTIKVYDFNMADGESLDVKTPDVATAEEEVVKKSEKYVPVSDEQRIKVAQILKEVQQNKDFFTQIQQQSPEVYASIVSVVQSLTAILQGDKEAKEKHVAKMIEKINKQLDNHSGKAHGKVAKEIQKIIDRESDEQYKKDKEDHMKLHKLARDNHKQRVRDAQEFASKTGHDPEFLGRLIGAFRK